MVAQLLRLKLALFANTLRRGRAQRAGIIVGVLCGLAIVVIGSASIAGLRDDTPDIARVILTVFGSVIVAGFLLLPLAFSADDPMDARRFSLFGLPAGRLALGLALAGALSIPTAITAVLLLAQVVAWSEAPVPALLAVLGVAVLLATCVLAARVSTAVAASVLSNRRSREGSGIALIAILAIVAPLAAVLATIDWQSQTLPVMRRLAAVLEWTPLGAVWSAPGDAALGHADTALLKLLIGLGFLVVLWVAWRGLVGRLLSRPDHETATRRYSGLGWFARLPATPRGVIAARSLSYWGRDSRYHVALAVIPVVPVLMVAALLVAGVPTEVIVWVPVPVMALFLGWSVHNDLAHDSTAFWSHVSASTRGVDDRWGRLVPALLLGVPLVAVGSALTALVAGDVTILPGVAGLSACVLFVALGISSLVSAAFPYPAVHPGDSPFAQPQATNSGSAVQALSFLLAIVLSLPIVAIVIFEPGMPWLALGAGIGLGLVVLAAGVFWGGHLVNRRAPELLAFTLQN